MGGAVSESTFMRHLNAVLALAVCGGLAATATSAQSWSNASGYNGYGASSQNTPSNYQLRDQNGNLTLVNGQVQSSQYSSQTGTQYAGATGGGVGASGAGAQYGQATAI